jgi:sortase A
VLVTLGLLILLFVAYQLWGTGLITARAQDNLKDDFARAREQYATEQTTTTRPGPTSTTVFPATSTTSPVRPAPPVPPEGEVEGTITIPKIGVNWAFVEGVSRDDLKKGPGHYPDTPMPGTMGNAAIAGHRTTYGAPFGNVDQLQPGDEINIETLAGKFTYEMTSQLIVKPTDVHVVDNTLDAQLTLTSCHPKFSAEQRIVIKAKLVANKSDRPTRPQPQKPASRGGKTVSRQTVLEEGLSGQERSASSAVGWGLAVLILGLAWWWAFRRWRHPIVWVAGVIPFLAVLFGFYVYFEQALPAGY